MRRIQRHMLGSAGSITQTTTTQKPPAPAGGFIFVMRKNKRHLEQTPGAIILRKIARWLHSEASTFLETLFTDTEIGGCPIYTIYYT